MVSVAHVPDCQASFSCCVHLPLAFFLERTTMFLLPRVLLPFVCLVVGLLSCRWHLYVVSSSSACLPYPYICLVVVSILFGKIILDLSSQWSLLLFPIILTSFFVVAF